MDGLVLHLGARPEQMRAPAPLAPTSRSLALPLFFSLRSAGHPLPLPIRAPSPRSHAHSSPGTCSSAAPSRADSGCPSPGRPAAARSAAAGPAARPARPPPAATAPRRPTWFFHGVVLVACLLCGDAAGVFGLMPRLSALGYAVSFWFDASLFWGLWVARRRAPSAVGSDGGGGPGGALIRRRVVGGRERRRRRPRGGSYWTARRRRPRAARSFVRLPAATRKRPWQVSPGGGGRLTSR